MARQDGEPHGCTDQAPSSTSEHVLSRILDVLDALRNLNAALTTDQNLHNKRADAFFASLPLEVKLEFNYAKWRYRKL